MRVPVQLVTQKALHLVFAIFLLHHHQGRILREGFAKHGRDGKRFQSPLVRLPQEGLTRASIRLCVPGK
jgi:hypothetical protein